MLRLRSRSVLSCEIEVTTVLVCTVRHLVVQQTPSFATPFSPSKVFRFEEFNTRYPLVLTFNVFVNYISLTHCGGNDIPKRYLHLHVNVTLGSLLSVTGDLLRDHETGTEQATGQRDAGRPPELELEGTGSRADSAALSPDAGERGASVDYDTSRPDAGRGRQTFSRCPAPAARPEPTAQLRPPHRGAG